MALICDDLYVQELSGTLTTSCGFTTNSNFRRTDYITNVSKYVSEGMSSGKGILCEFDSIGGTGRLLSNSNSPITIDLDPNKYYIFSSTLASVDKQKFITCREEEKSKILEMSEQLAIGSGSSIWGNLNDIIPFFVVIIGIVFGYYFLHKIIKKGNRGDTF